MNIKSSSQGAITRLDKPLYLLQSFWLLNLEWLTSFEHVVNLFQARVFLVSILSFTSMFMVVVTLTVSLLSFEFSGSPKWTAIGGSRRLVWMMLYEFMQNIATSVGILTISSTFNDIWRSFHGYIIHGKDVLSNVYL